MKKLALFALCLPSLWLTGPAHAADSCPETLAFTRQTLASEENVDLCREYAGKVVMVVNTASFCGFTNQYKGLEGLYEKYRQRGFVILGFPSNDFGQQEPGNEDDIKAFCERTYGVKFPMFAKTEVRSGTTDPLYRKLGNLAGEYPSWNFHKYLLDRNGKLVASFPSRIEPQSSSVVRQIEALL